MILFVVQLCQICTENPDIVLLKVDFDENRDTVKPLGIKVGLLFAVYCDVPPFCQLHYVRYFRQICS